MVQKEKNKFYKCKVTHKSAKMYHYAISAIN